MSRHDDEVWMKRAIALARRAEGRTAPNPMVGCVIVDGDGKIVSQAFHEQAGKSHAEIAALEKLDFRAPGCTMYVNLEPCVHHGRTGPCAPAVAAAGIVRLVVGMRDPIPDHAGGAEWLEKRGLEVAIGVLDQECAELNRAFTMWARERRPLFVVKAAVTLDGRMATRAGKSLWITGERSRADVHRLRDRLDAVMTGVGTVLADDPRLTVRDIDGGRDPVRVIVDSRLRTPPTARVLPRSSGSPARVAIATTEAAPADAAARLESEGAEIWRLPSHGARVDLRALADKLAAENVLGVLSEGGPELSAALVAAQLADEVVLYMAPSIVGGPGTSWIGGEGVEDLAQAWRFELAGEVQTMGRDIKMTFRPRPA